MRKPALVDSIEKWLTQRPDHEFQDNWRTISPQETSRLPAFTRFSSSDAPSPAATIRNIVLRESHRLLAADDYVQRLAVVEKNLNKEVKPSLRQIRKKIKEHCRELDSVEIRASFDFSKPSLQVQLYVKRQGQETDLEKSGEGRRRRVMLAIHEANLQLMQREAALSTAILAYDEPDTHLDYNSQRTLFDILSQQANIPHIQVLIATHSLNFIDRVPLQSLLHFRLSDELKTEVETLISQDQEHEVEFLAAVCAGLGLRNSVLLDERCFLVVEGETEEKAIPMLFRLVTGQALAASGVTLLHLTGYGAARRLIEILVCEWNRDAVLLVDSDSRSDRGGDITNDWLGKLGIADGEGAFFIGKNDFEDAFSDRLWLEVLRQHFPPMDGNGNWTVSELAALRKGDEKYGHSLCNLVRRRCKNNKIGKPEIGLALARTCKTTGQVPSVLRNCFSYARNIANGKRS